MVGSSACTLLESGGGSAGGLEDADGVICLRPTENPGPLRDRMHHHQKRFQLNETPHFSWSFRESFTDDFVLEAVLDVMRPKKFNISEDFAIFKRMSDLATDCTMRSWRKKLQSSVMAFSARA